jgi:hypothetical protein
MQHVRCRSVLDIDFGGDMEDRVNLHGFPTGIKFKWKHKNPHKQTHTNIYIYVYRNCIFVFVYEGPAEKSNQS